MDNLLTCTNNPKLRVNPGPRDGGPDNVVAFRPAVVSKRRFEVTGFVHNRPRATREFFPVRATTRTEISLQAILVARRLTFWGEAVNLVFEFFALNPDLAPPVPNLATLPRILFGRTPANRHAKLALCSKNIACTLSPLAWAWINRSAKVAGVTAQDAAAALIHCHVDLAASHLLAAEAGE